MIIQYYVFQFQSENDGAEYWERHLKIITFLPLNESTTGPRPTQVCGVAVAAGNTRKPWLGPTELEN